MIWENNILLIYYRKAALSSSYLQKTRSRAKTHARERYLSGKKETVPVIPVLPDRGGGWAVRIRVPLSRLRMRFRARARFLRKKP
jgi:hypothetical protein